MSSSKYSKMEDKHQLVNGVEQEKRYEDTDASTSAPEPQAEIVPVEVIRDPHIQASIYRSAGHAKIVVILCILQLTMSGLCFITQLALVLETAAGNHDHSSYMRTELYTGFWFAPLTVIPGVVGLFSAIKHQFRLVVVTMVSNILICHLLGGIFIISKTTATVTLHHVWIYYCQQLAEMNSRTTTATTTNLLIRNLTSQSHVIGHHNYNNYYFWQSVQDCTHNLTALDGCIIASMVALFVIGLIVSGFTCSASCCRPAKVHYMARDATGNPVVYKSRGTA